MVAGYLGIKSKNKKRVGFKEGMAKDALSSAVAKLGLRPGMKIAG